jgi:transposase-like protein
MGLRCKGCGSEEQVKNGFMRGKQRYRCKSCGLNFTDRRLDATRERLRRENPPDQGPGR